MQRAPGTFCEILTGNLWVPQFSDIYAGILQHWTSHWLSVKEGHVRSNNVGEQNDPYQYLSVVRIITVVKS